MYRSAQVQDKLLISNHEIETLNTNQSYKYLGIWLNINLDWNEHEQKLEQSINRVLTKIRNKAITPDQKIHCINVLINTKIAYSMPIVPLEAKIIIWSKTIKNLVKKATENTQGTDEAIFGEKNKGGRGLIQLEAVFSSIVATSFIDNGLNAPKDSYSRIIMHHLLYKIP
jgi:hypothetical protein